MFKNFPGTRSAKMNYSCFPRKTDQDVLFRKQGKDYSHRGMHRVSWELYRVWGRVPKSAWGGGVLVWAAIKEYYRQDDRLRNDTN